ncbi:MAG: SpoIID/LytB domain-containing protein, partial [Planctomycetota bacterium]
LLWGGSLLWDHLNPEPLRTGKAGPPPARLNPTVCLELSRFQGLRQVPIRLAGAWRVLREDGALLLEGTGFEGPLHLDPRGALLGSWLIGTDRFTLVTEGDAAVRVADTTYRGVLRISIQREGRAALPASFGLELDLPLEDYVLGVVCGEMPTSSPGVQEALRAQAVAARTYALWRLAQDGRGRLHDDSRDQRFHGVDFETEAARKAVQSTLGQVLTWAGRLLPAFYHADCGGQTADAGVFRFLADPVPPLAGVSDEDTCHAIAEWERIVSPQELDELAVSLGLGSWIRKLASLERDASGRWILARVEGDRRGTEVPADSLAARFAAPSTRWTFLDSRPDGSLLVRGNGRGHGVGLCQNGALIRARRGEKAAGILAHYYPGARVRNVAELAIPLP